MTIAISNRHCNFTISYIIKKFLFTFGSRSSDATTFGGGCLSGLVLLDACKFGVNHNTSAVLANNNFLTHSDVHLTLGGDFAETAGTSVTLNVYDSKAVT